MAEETDSTMDARMDNANVSKIMRKSFLEYAMSVIVSREEFQHIIS